MQCVQCAIMRLQHQCESQAIRDGSGVESMPDLDEVDVITIQELATTPSNYADITEAGILSIYSNGLKSYCSLSTPMTIAKPK